MNELKIIDQREVLGKDFKVYGDFENPLFLAKDVATWIDYDLESVNKMLSYVDGNEKLTGTIFRSGQNREMWFLTEDGLYEVLMLSRKPFAKQFKVAVKEILRSVRKHGAYMTPAKIEEVLLNPDTIIRLATDLKNERAKAVALESQVKELKPKADFADAYTATDGCILVREMAKILTQNGFNVGQNNFYDALVRAGLLFRKHGAHREEYEPTQYAMGMGLFRIVKSVVTKPDKSIACTTVKVTPKGQEYLLGRFTPRVPVAMGAEAHIEIAGDVLYNR
jgi:anti-repressor protein